MIPSVRPDSPPDTVRGAGGLYLDLGSGPEPAPGHLGVDLGGDGVRVLHFDLFDGRDWPWEDETVDGLRAWHVIEHIPRERVSLGTATAIGLVKRPGQPPQKMETVYRRTQDAFFRFFDEAFRVAKPGARFELAWPHPWHDHADQDPTHARRIPVSTLHYLSAEGRRLLRVNQYPVSCDWRIVEGSVQILTTSGSPVARPDDVNVFHEIRATLHKPTR